MDFIPLPVVAKPSEAVQFDTSILEEIKIWINARDVERMPHPMNPNLLGWAFHHPRGQFVTFPGEYIIKTNEGVVYTAEPGMFYSMFSFVEELKPADPRLTDPQFRTLGGYPPLKTGE